MSSLLSRQLLDDAGPLVAAATDVAETSLFTFVDPSDAATFAAAAAAAGDQWLSARVMFAGPANGGFTLTLPAASAQRLCAAFSGEDSLDAIGPEARRDFVGEVANMICGAWLTRVSRDHAFALSTPAVTSGALAPQDGGEADGARSTFLAIDDAPVRLDIVCPVPAAGSRSSSDGR